MSNPVRRIAVRVAVLGAVGVSSLALTPAAFASQVSSVKSHLRHADVALRAVRPAAGSGMLGVQLSQLTTQLGIAAQISAKLTVSAKLPQTEKIAATALHLVTQEEAKAQTALTAVLSTVQGVEAQAVVKADLQVTQGEELTLSVLSHLAIDTQAQLATIKAEVATLSGDAASLLEKLVSDVTPPSIGCTSASVRAHIVAKDTASVQADTPGVDATVPVLGDVLNAGGSLVASLTSGEVVQVQADVQADVNCQPTDAGGSGSPSDGSTGSTGGSGSPSDGSAGSTSGSGSVTAKGSTGLLAGLGL